MRRWAKTGKLNEPTNGFGANGKIINNNNGDVALETRPHLDAFDSKSLFLMLSVAGSLVLLVATGVCLVRAYVREKRVQKATATAMGKSD